MTTHSRRFELHRDTDISGVSGTGVVADGVAFPDGTVALRWRSAWPTSVVFHDRGVEGVEAIHGHGGATRIVWLDDLHLTDERPDGTVQDQRITAWLAVAEHPALRSCYDEDGPLLTAILDRITELSHHVPPAYMIALRERLHALIAALDTARAEGIVFTYGGVQASLREALAAHPVIDPSAVERAARAMYVALREDGGDLAHPDAVTDWGYWQGGVLAALAALGWEEDDTHEHQWVEVTEHQHHDRRFLCVAGCGAHRAEEY